MRKPTPKRTIAPDSVYNSILVAKFINLLMLNGKKELSRRVVYKLLTDLEEQYKKPGLEVFEEALDKIRPTVVLKARRVGGSNFQVPTPIDRERGVILAVRWLIEAARKRKGAPIGEDLMKEITDVMSDQGDLLKRREDTHRMAEANKAFSHFR